MRLPALTLLFCLFIPVFLQAQLRLPEIISENMVIQRDQEIRIWGWTTPGESVQVDFSDETHETTADETGRWKILLPAVQAGGPYVMTIRSAEDTRVLDNVLAGEVWLFSGQSNMVHYLELHKERYAREIAAANHQDIRQFLVPTNPVLTGPADNLPETTWKPASGEDIMRFSVVAYFFALAIQESLNVPVGIINASVGGTPIEAWTSEEGLKEFDLSGRISRNKDTALVNEINRKAQSIRQNYQQSLPEDAGLNSETPWFEGSLKTTTWPEINVPGYWEDQGVRDLNGIVWYRKEVEIPSAMAGKEVQVKLGRIIDADRLYVNGQLVGQTYYQYPQRRYTIPAGVLVRGKNTLTVRVVNNYGKGGFVPDKPYYMATAKDTLDLKGYWKYKVGAVFPDPPRAGGVNAQNEPTALYNGMIAPYTQFRIRGFAWYQGESNTGDPTKYARLQPALIQDWRHQWENEELPFLFVQLPNFMEVNYSPAESNWAAFREAQRKTLEIPNTAMAVAIDLGEWNDIHPGNKKPVGQRLALAARALVYGEEIEFSGPVFREAERQGDDLLLTFDHAAEGITTPDGAEPKWFAVAGANKEFSWAKAQIQENAVLLENAAEAVYVRYGWADNPSGGLIYNSSGLPASPFEITVGNPNAARDSMYQATQTDHRQMLKQLGITDLRPGPSGNPAAPNAANADESKVRPYTLPDPLKSENGRQVKNARAWNNERRPEIIELFDREVYGRVPAQAPSIRWEVISEKDTVIGNFPAKEKLLHGIADNAATPDIDVTIELQVVTPREATTAVPLIMEFGFIRWPWGPPPAGGAGLFSTGEPPWKEQVLSRGWGYAILVPSSIQADNGAGLREGIIGLANSGDFRKPDDWGSLRAWAWGASRAMDYFESDPDIDAGRVAIEGLSRYGKAALVAMAYEPRISIGFIGSSGAGGAKLLRRNFGEQVENLASSAEYHWFAGNFLHYASTKTPDDLPVDAHQLIALCAPRPVFISAGSPLVEGNWIDAKGMFDAAVAASPVFEITGVNGLNTITYPPLGEGIMDGELAFRQHAGGHTTGPNWSTFLAWACRYWGDCKL